MDNMARFYKFRIDQVAKLIQDGEKDKALDMLWELRLKSDLGLYCRAMVNLMLATEVDLEEHPDAPKFAQECLHLLDQISRDGLVEDAMTEQEVSRLRGHARQTLMAIEDEMSALDARKREALAGSDLEVDWNYDREATTENDSKADDDNMATVDAGESVRWTLEGAYNDGYAVLKNPLRSPALPAIFEDPKVQEQSNLPTLPATNDPMDRQDTP